METIEFILKALAQFFSGFIAFFKGIGSAFGSSFNFVAYGELINEYTSTNGGFAWAIVALVVLVLLAILAGIIFVLILFIKKLVKVAKSLKAQDRLLREISKLTKENAFLRIQVDKHLRKELKNQENVQAEGEDGGEHRFSKLLVVDQKYANGNPEVLNDSFTLLEVCHNFRNFAASRLKLFYDEEIVREFVAALSCVRLIILQGISGTGKTSLPYGFGKFLDGDGSFIQAIQPSWRERSEMVGFFNEFTKKYKEPEFLRNLYEANYSNNVHLTVLDEMNIARVEYYFAEFLSTLEVPRPEEWVVELVSKSEPDDPKLLKDGKMLLPPNMWYVGTANNDDSTFAISDKVYDRAIIIDIDKKFVPFEPVDCGPMSLDYRHLMKLFQEAKEKHQISQENREKIAQLDLYVIEHFRIAFGNRIMRQLENFVPAYMECGGTEVNAIDFMLLKKVFRKFATLSNAWLKREIFGFTAMIDNLWGDNSFPQTRAFIESIAKTL